MTEALGATKADLGTLGTLSMMFMTFLCLEICSLYAMFPWRTMPSRSIACPVSLTACPTT
eukprot:CAMPEP_0113921080 /NCGR_PEP_ID=MMETSP1159-20121227/888_1 /TAXON_ID=88271 /ORGANISM="Picocystis salinarum" /LENGTH=59 /DNA_ID=CAMNT_0000921097 /DNA_START=717 /DNA_END=896 /DNA_ORIENTATION=+ /assembly_acc=CAM_ASM_000767